MKACKVSMALGIFSYCIILVAAAANDGLLGVDLPNGFRAFHAESPWNTPIVPNPKASPFSSMIIERLKSASKSQKLKISYRNWTIPLWVIDTDKVTGVRVRFRNDAFPRLDPDDKGYVDNVPVPIGVRPDPKRMRSWDFSRARLEPDGQWSVTRLDTWNLRGSGVREPYSLRRWWMSGARGSGMPLIAGLVRKQQIDAGRIEHALAFASPINRKSSIKGGLLELCLPANRNDGTHIGPDTLPMGGRMQLDPDLDLDALGLSEEAKVVARALQVYGMYNSDSTHDSFKIYFQGLGERNSPWNDYDFSGLSRIPIEAFRVLDCDIRFK